MADHADQVGDGDNADLDDQDPRLALGLSAIQWAALLTLGYYVFVFRQQPAPSA